MKHYTIENKPIFIQDQLVAVDMACFGFPMEKICVGKIVGKSFTHVIDNWLVEFDDSFGPTYPFKVIPVPHTFILESISLMG
jgi:hypothetical protein